MTCFGTSAALHRRVHEGGRRAGAGARPERAAQRRLDRLAAVARGLPLGLRQARRGRRGCSRRAAARTCARRSSAASRRCPSTRASCRPASLGADVEAWDEDGNAADRRGRRARDHRADAVDADLLLGRRGRRRGCARATSTMYPGVWRHGDWIEITDARDGDHLRPLGLDDQPRRDPHGHERDLPRRARRSTRSSTRSWSTSRGGRRRAGCRCSSCCARARRSTTTWSSAIATRIREDCSPRHVPNEVHAIAEVPRTLSGKVLEVPVKRILMGAAAGQGREPRLARRTPRRSTTSSTSRSARDEAG